MPHLGGAGSLGLLDASVVIATDTVIDAMKRTYRYRRSRVDVSVAAAYTLSVPSRRSLPGGLAVAHILCEPVRLRRAAPIGRPWTALQNRRRRLDGRGIPPHAVD